MDISDGSSPVAPNENAGAAEVVPPSPNVGAAVAPNENVGAAAAVVAAPPNENGDDVVVAVVPVSALLNENVVVGAPKPVPRAGEVSHENEHGGHKAIQDLVAKHTGTVSDVLSVAGVGENVFPNVEPKVEPKVGAAAGGTTTQRRKQR